MGSCEISALRFLNCRDKKVKAYVFAQGGGSFFSR